MICLQKMREDKDSTAGLHPILMAVPASTLRRRLKGDEAGAQRSGYISCGIEDLEARVSVARLTLLFTLLARCGR
jgi:hypothetical protein